MLSSAVILSSNSLAACCCCGTGDGDRRPATEVGITISRPRTSKSDIGLTCGAGGITFDSDAAAPPTAVACILERMYFPAVALFLPIRDCTRAVSRGTLHTAVYKEGWARWTVV